MIFEPMENLVDPDVPMWCARRGDHSFIITDDGGLYHVSSRLAYTTEPRPIHGQLIDLGEYKSMGSAIEACTSWRP